MQLDGTVTLITGASDGIGQWCRDPIRRTGGPGSGPWPRSRPDPGRCPVRQWPSPELADLASPHDRGELIARAEQVFGRVDVLVNNAGIGWSGPFTQMKVNEIRRVLEVDLLAAVELTHSVLPGMVRRRRGAVCFVTSIAAGPASGARPCTRPPRPGSTRSPTAFAARRRERACTSPLWYRASSTPDSSKSAAIRTTVPGRSRCRPRRWPMPCSKRSADAQRRGFPDGS